MEIVKTPKYIKSLFPSLNWQIKTSKKEVYLTFDDSPTKFTYWILELLKNLEIRATFFCIGKNAERYPKIISQIILEGHQIGYHGYSHKNGLLTSTKSYLSDLIKCEKVLPSSTLFRPPYGKMSFFQIRAIQKKYKIIMWDILSYDFKKNITKKKLTSNVLKNVENGSIIVFHDNEKSEINLKKSLENILVQLKNRGYKFKLFSSYTKEI